MKFLSLDISTNTGYAVFDTASSLKLLHYNVFTYKVKAYKGDVRSYQDFPPEYPHNFIRTANDIALRSVSIAKKYGCACAVIEHSEKGKQRLSQRLLEWIHLYLVKALQINKIEFKYLLVSDWRKEVKCYLKHWPEYQKWNKEVSKAKRKCIGRKLAKIDGKVVSKINQKKLSIILANEYFNIQIKDDNVADAINLGKAAYELGMF